VLDADATDEAGMERAPTHRSVEAAQHGGRLRKTEDMFSCAKAVPALP
jgi:hypothetical protein